MLRVTAPATQQQSGLKPGDPWEYTVVYSNLGDVTAFAELRFQSPLIDREVTELTPVCVATGAATCPPWITSLAFAFSYPGTPAVIPPGESLTVTFRGTVPPSYAACGQPSTVYAAGIALPQTPFQLTEQELNYNIRDWYPDQGRPFLGNNGYSLLTQISDFYVDGSWCGPGTYDLSAELQLFDDPARSQPNGGTFVPGESLWFRAVMTSLPPGETLEQITYSLAPGLIFRASVADLTCTPFNGGACPAQMEPWVSVDASVAEGSYVVITGRIDTTTSANKSIGDGQGGDWYISPNTRCVSANTDRLLRTYPDSSVVSASTVGVATGSERTLNNNTSAVQLTWDYDICATGLTVTKEVVDPYLRLDGTSTWRITATNNSPDRAVDVPRLFDLNYTGVPVTSAQVTCTAAGGAACPTHDVVFGRSVAADGTVSDFDPASSTNVFGEPLFDITWGGPGQETMPPGSSVTFDVTLNQAENAGWYNQAVFISGSQADVEWMAASSGDAVGLKNGSQLGLVKQVSPHNPAPGQKVTYTVDLVNTGADAESVFLTDTISAALRATNPNGYADLTCRALTDADDVFPKTEPVAALTCPTFVSDANGITGELAMPHNSGLRLTYTAIAPLTSTSSTNVIAVHQDSAYAITGDANAQVNIYVQAISLSGTVWHDYDGSASGFTNIRTGTETGTNATGLTAVLTTPDHFVLATVPVAADGTYTFTAPMNRDVQVHLTRTGTEPAVGTVFDQAVLPDGWEATTPATRDVRVDLTTVTGVDFGVQQPPTTDDLTVPVQPNPGGTVRVPVPTLTGHDAEDRAVTTLIVTTLPTNATLYYRGEPVTVGQRITDYDPTALTVDPDPGALTVVFGIAFEDSAGSVSRVPGVVTMPFSAEGAAALSGQVWVDSNGNGVRDSDEQGIAGVLITLTGTDDLGASVTRTTLTAADRTYTFDNLRPGTYTVRQTQPTDFLDGAVRVGTSGGTAGTNEVTGITLVSGTVGTGYDFAERLATDPNQPVDPGTQPPVKTPVTTPSPTLPGTTTPTTGTTTPKTTATTKTTGTLARTGTDVAQTLVLSLGLIVVGAAALTRSRRRRS